MEALRCPKCSSAECALPSAISDYMRFEVVTTASFENIRPSQLFDTVQGSRDATPVCGANLSDRLYCVVTLPDVRSGASEDAAQYSAVGRLRRL
jgi:hypothetical protein